MTLDTVEQIIIININLQIDLLIQMELKISNKWFKLILMKEIIKLFCKWKLLKELECILMSNN